MNQAAKKLVDEIDALPDRDRSELVAELVRVWPWVPTICPTTTTLLRLPTACSSSSIVRSNLNEIAQRGEDREVL